MKKVLFYTICILALWSCHSKPAKKIAVTKTDSTAVYHVPDEQEIDRVVQYAYASVTFKQGEQPRYDTIKKYFIPQAQLINYEADSAQITSIDQFIYLYRTHVEADSIKAFSENEIFGKTEQFGRIAERISTYKTIMVQTDTVIKKGVNSFQLIKTNGGWKITSIIWDIENPLVKIPPYYLGKHYTDSVIKKAPKQKHWIKAKDLENK